MITRRKFQRHSVAAAVGGLCSTISTLRRMDGRMQRSLAMATVMAVAAPQLAIAGSGWSTTDDPTYSLGIMKSYWANSPSGIWSADCLDPVAGTRLAAVAGGPCDSGGNVNGFGLRKFVDTLPGLTATGANNLGNYIPVAVADTSTYAGADYYEIAVVEFRQKMHSDMPGNALGTLMRGYVQVDPAATDAAAGLANGAIAPAGSKAVPLINADGTPAMISRPDASSASGFRIVQAYGVDKPFYLGPIITATQHRPTRVKLYDALPVGRADATGKHGDIALPVDETLPGAGFGPEGKVKYTQNRVLIHLHGGDNPWIGDGTPHQWITPAGEADLTNPKSVAAEAAAAGVSAAPFLRGPGAINVPDMPDPGPGAMTYYYPNGLTARLEWYHDHSFGMTRLNVYEGVASAYRVTDAFEATLTAAGGPLNNVPEIPLVIQDKTFVPQNVATQDDKWDSTYWGGVGDFWYGHVYETNQNPKSATNTNDGGRWDWGPWFWPVFPSPMDVPTGEHKIYGILSDGVTPNPATTVGNASYVASAGTSPFLSNTARTSWTNSRTGVTLDGPSALGMTEVTLTPETFNDTVIVNGVVYPSVTVEPKAYRFRILNAANDRMLNLGFYLAADASTVNPLNPFVNPAGTGAPSLCDGTQAAGANCAEVRMVAFSSPNGPTVTTFNCPTALGGVVLPAGQKAGWTPVSAQYPNSFPCSPEAYTPAYPGLMLDNGQMLGTGWGSADNRPGGVPDPTTAGPSIHVIGNEGGFLHQVMEIPSTPINYEYNKRSVTVLNVAEKGLFLGTAYRADAVVDFSAYAGKTLILYNDAPAPMPAGDPRLDYFTGMGDQTGPGGAPNVMPGYGPTTRTIMQVKVLPAVTTNTANLLPGTTTYNFQALDTAIKNGILAGEQPPPIVPSTAYQSTYGNVAPYTSDVFSSIYTGVPYLGNYKALSFTTTGPLSYTPAPGGGVTALPTGGTTTYPPCSTGTTCQAQLAKIKALGPVTVPAGTAISANVESKAIQELFEPTYGRMNATLGVELPFTSALTQTTIPLGYIDPATEKVSDGETQFWKITHNGVDSHPVHFHLVNVQVINRVGWDGMIKPPYASEAGWKDTVVMNPLEDIVVAVQTKKPQLPFGLPHSYRLNDPTQPAGVLAGFTQVDPLTGNAATVANTLTDFMDEYVWHCHILGHEENDFMRSVIFDPKDKVPGAPTTVAATGGGTSASITWTDPTPATAAGTLGNPQNEIGFRVERQAVGTTTWTPGATVRSYPGATFTANVNTLANATTYTDANVVMKATPPAAANAPGSAVTVNPTATTAANVQVSWTWTVPAGGTAPLAFDVMRAEVNAAGVVGTFTKLSAAQVLVAATATSAAYTDATAVPGAKYEYEVIGYGAPSGNVAYNFRVVAVNAVGETASAASTTPVTLATTLIGGGSTSAVSGNQNVPMLPVTGPITATDDGTATAPVVNFNWPAPTFNGANIAASYNLAWTLSKAVTTTRGGRTTTTTTTTPGSATSTTPSYSLAVPSAPAGTVYSITNFGVTSVSADGVATATPDVLASLTLAPPASPGSITASRLATAPDTTVTAYWPASVASAAAGPANSYVVRVATNAAFTAGLTTTAVATLPTAAAPVSFTLLPNTQYWLDVAGVNGLGTGAYNATPANLWTAPAAPTVAPTPGVATSGGDSFGFAVAPAGTTWTVQVSTSSTFATAAAVTGCANVSAATASCSVTGLLPNTTYYARVVITNPTSTLSSLPGASSAAFATAFATPVAPTFGAATNASRVVNFAAIAGGATGTVQISTSPTFATLVASTGCTGLAAGATTCTAAGLAANTAYYARMVLTSTTTAAVTTGAASAVFYTAPATPAAPTFGTVTGNSVVTNFAAVPTGMTGSVQFSTLPTFATIVAPASCTNLAAGTSTCTATGLLASTVYYARMIVTSTVSALSSTASPSGTVTTAAGLPTPVAPTLSGATDVSVNVGFASAPVGGTWSVQLSTSAAFTPLVTTPAACTNVAAATTSCAFTGLTANTGYYARIVTATAAGLSPVGASTALTYTLPAAPAAIAAQRGATGSRSITVNGLTAPAAGTTYTLQYSTSATFATIAGSVNVTAAGSRAFGGLVAGTTYYFRLVATGTTSTLTNSTAVVSARAR